MKTYKAILLILLVLLIDQGSKLWVKTHMMMNEQIFIASWFRILFTENPGMAFGMELPGMWGKLFLSSFRLVVVIAGVWFLRKLIREKAHWGFVYCASLVFAGALGNMVDGLFYGAVFNDSYGRIAEFMPSEGGYNGWLGGYVVDMLYFPIIRNDAGEVLFFSPVFNVADSAITVGVFLIIIFQKQFFPEENKQALETDPAIADAEEANLS